MLMIHTGAHSIETNDSFAVNRSSELLPVDAITDRLARTPIRTLKSHEQLFREGEAKSNIYQVLEGAFVLYRLLPNGRRQVTGFAISGDMLGLGAGNHHQCSAECSGVAKVRALPAITLHRMAREDSHLGMRLYDAISQELATVQDLLMTVGRLNASERVATFLLGLSERNARALRPADRIELPMTRCDIADFLGLTTETISRTLTKFTIGKFISRHQGHIRILDGQGLEDVASGERAV
jgi:CRP/FNR family transcriptional regulator, anaerobic regulatory protein